MTSTFAQLPGRPELVSRLATVTEDTTVFGLLALNINGFRSVNAGFGPAAGDELLNHIAERVQSILRDSDILYRIGADEFVVLLGTLRGAHQITLAASRIETLCHSLIAINDHELRVRVRMGGCTFPHHGNNTGELLKSLDIAMEQAAKQERTFVLFTPEHADNGQPRLLLEGSLEQALDLNQFELHFQPKISLSSHRMCGAEALARWHHPKHGRIAPDQFIPVLENSDLVLAFTEWTLNAALRQCGDCRQEFGCLALSVNLSARSLHHPELAALIIRTMQLWDTEPGSLTIEVTESAIMSNPDTCLATLQQLHERGVRISIDDFGTGYSSLAYLRNLPAHELKIDKSFVLEMLHSPADEKLVRSIIDLGHNLDLSVTAEGVEDEQTLERLQALGCDEVQGFYLARPMPGADIKQWIKESPWGLDLDTPRYCKR